MFKNVLIHADTILTVEDIFTIYADKEHLVKSDSVVCNQDDSQN